MLFMNTYEIDEARLRFAAHPILGPASQTLANLRDAADSCSDGWCYWPKPARAARKLMELIQGPDRTRPWETARPDATAEALRKAYAPLKAFRTREGGGIERGCVFEIVEPAERAR